MSSKTINPLSNLAGLAKPVEPEFVMHKRTPAIAQALRYYRATVLRVSLTSFKNSLKKVLSPKEATEVFEYYTSVKPCLAVASERMFTWTCKQDHFNDPAVNEMVVSLGLADVQDKRNKPASKPKSNPAPKPSENTLESYSTEELAAELVRRGWCVSFGIV